MRRGNKPRPAGSLKAAARALIEAAGGLERAAEFSRVGRSQLFRCSDESDEHAQVHLAVDVVAALEARAGEPIVTRWLAASAGHVLLDVGRAGDALDADLARVGREVSELFARYAEARDARSAGGAGVTRAEAGRLVAELDDALAALAALRVDLTGAWE